GLATEKLNFGSRMSGGGCGSGGMGMRNIREFNEALQVFEANLNTTPPGGSEVMKNAILGACNEVDRPSFKNVYGSKSGRGAD
ncbi:hypothetical protein SDJN02_17433, partial [Cucurbita argyrosperma subsp. argyrosperma]